MAGQHAFVVQHLFDVELVEAFHVRGQVLDFVVGRGGRRGGGLGQAAVHGDAAQGDQDFAVVVHGADGDGINK